MQITFQNTDILWSFYKTTQCKKFAKKGKLTLIHNKDQYIISYDVKRKCVFVKSTSKKGLKNDN